MISKIKFNMVAVFILAIGVFAGAALAQDTTTAPNPDNTQKQGKFERRGRGGEGFRGDRRGGPEGMLRQFRDINLTDAQKQQIKTILDSNKPDEGTMQEMHTLGQAVRDGSSTPEQQARLKTLSEQVMQNRKAVREQIQNVLTPEQKTQLEAKRKERQQQFQDRKQFRRQDKPATDKSATKPIDG
jgi:Spy/CpxP family protein refolding chaperone